METYGKFSPIVNYSDDEEILQQEQQETCNQLPRINRRKLFKTQQIPRYFTEEDTTSSETSSSSSSSSSESSDSEIEELGNQLQRRTHLTRGSNMKLKQQRQEKKWVKVVDLQGLRPEDVKVVVNPVKRVLIVKMNKRGLSLQQQQRNNVLRIVPLPRSICLQKLRVKVTPIGELVVKAPFRCFHDEEQEEQITCPTQHLPTWAPIHVTYKGKGNNIFGQQQKEQFYNCISLPVRRHTSMLDSSCNTQQLLPNFQQGRQQQRIFPNTQYVRDEMTGKMAILLHVNTIGFRPEEIRVRLNNTQEVLIVEAGQRGNIEQITQRLFQMQQTVMNVKYLRREFTLPRNTNVNKIAYQVQRNGIVTIKVPITQKKQFGTMRQRSNEKNIFA